MQPVDRHFVVGYDPGGNGRHGLAVLQVQQQRGLWVASHIVALKALPDAQAVIACAEACIGSGTLVATGIDTLTAWSGGPSGWRQADLWLRERYPAVKNSVASPNSLFGSMSIGGGLLLHWLSQRQDHGGVVTEAHPGFATTPCARSCTRGPNMLSTASAPRAGAGFFRRWGWVCLTRRVPRTQTTASTP
ncbi:MAG: hypothetical protein IPO43_03475 [Rhodoferax sp.]|nr:hypothetical protein [Rhodoferax sp.]